MQKNITHIYKLLGISSEVEQITVNDKVIGSIPIFPAKAFIFRKALLV